MRFLTLLFLFLNGPAALAQKNASPEWVSLAEAEKRLNEEAIPIIISLYTDWCGWCKQMDRKTWSDPRLRGYLAGRFSAVKMNAESRSELRWKGERLRFRPEMRAHELVLRLAGPRLSFPSTIIIPAPDIEPQLIPGYISPTELEPVLKYFGEGDWKNTDFGKFLRGFKKQWTE